MRWVETDGSYYVNKIMNLFWTGCGVKEFRMGMELDGEGGWLGDGG